MAESTIPVDLMNPGQVFACLGFMELTQVLLGDAEAAFDWSDRHATLFRLSSAQSESPVSRVMRFLEEAELATKAPPGSRNVQSWKSSWGSPPEVVAIREPFPFPDPTSPATLPAVLRDRQGCEVMFDYWGDATCRDNVKFWAGSGGYPGAAMLRDALKLVRGKLLQHSGNPFALDSEQSSSFRFDWRRDYVPVHDGFSPNKHEGIKMVGFPLVELLAAIGVSHARPLRHHKLEYNYSVLGGKDHLMFDPIFHRAALGSKETPIPGARFRSFCMRLENPGKDDRSITLVTEETTK